MQNSVLALVAWAMLCWAMNCDGVLAQGAPGKRDFVCDEASRDECRQRTLGCLNRTCDPSGANPGTGNQECRAQCFTGLQRCLVLAGCR